MSNPKIKIKTGDIAGAYANDPSMDGITYLNPLENGELGYNAWNNGLYIGYNGTNYLLSVLNGEESQTFYGVFNGNADSADKLRVAKSIQTDLASTSSAYFNGSKNITPGVTGTLPIANGGTGATTAAGALASFGLTATAAELNHVDGVTSNIQTQLNNINEVKVGNISYTTETFKLSYKNGSNDEENHIAYLAPINSETGKIDNWYLNIDSSLSNSSENLVTNSIVTNAINSTNEFLSALTNDTANRFGIIEGIVSTNTAAIDVLKATDESHSESISTLNANVSVLQTEVQNKVNKEELEWASYVTDASVTLAVPSSSFKIVLDNNQIALMQGNNSAIFNNNTFTANSLAATSSITLGGLVFTNEGDAGYSIM